MESPEEIINFQLQQIASEKEKAADAKRTILDARIRFGCAISQLRKEIPSTKMRGQEIATRFPASQKMDVALRSDCRWLFEALYDENSEDSSILQALGIKSIHDVGSDNPTVIRRMYRQAKATKSI